VDVVTGPSSDVQPRRAAEELRTFASAVADFADLRNALTSPAVSMARKRAVITRLAEALGLSRIMRNFLLVLSDHRRAGDLPQVADIFEVLLDERLGFIRADVRSAKELVRDDQSALAGKLAAMTGKQVRMRFEVDGELIGGVVARIGSTVYDGSVRGQLAALGRRLATD
jgi:F-type H+-transporting ATPase subunit delta